MGLNVEGCPQFLVPMAKTCCHVAPYQCHGYCDYFGALRSAWLLNLGSPDRSVFWKNCHSHCNTYSSISSEWTTFSSSKPKTAKMCYFLLWNISNDLSPHPDSRAGLRCIDSSCSTSKAPKIRETSRVSWVHVCGVSFSNSCLAVIRSAESRGPGMSQPSNSNKVKLQLWVHCYGTVASTLSANL